MNFFKKLGLSLFILNLGLGGGVLLDRSNTAFAAEENDPIYIKQKQELTYAVNDRVNVVSSQAYTSYASEDSKATYEKAIADGNAILNNSSASIEDLAAATAKINEAKANIRREVDSEVNKIKLRNAIERSRSTTNAAKYILEKYPNTVAKVRDQLLALIESSERLISQAEAMLNR